MLNRYEIKQAIDDGRIGLSGHDYLRLQPASLDLCLGDSFLEYHSAKTGPIDPRVDNTIRMGGPYEPTISPGQFMLATTREVVELGNDVAAQVNGKSSLARLGLGVHVTAGFLDIGFHGSITLELVNHAPYPLILVPGMPICQLIFFNTNPMLDEDLYDGKYQKQRGATASRYHLNWDEERGAWK